MGFIDDCRGIYDENHRENIPPSIPIEEHVRNHAGKIQAQIKAMLRCDKYCANGFVHFFYRCSGYKREMIKESGFFHSQYESLYRFTCTITPDIVNIMQQVSNVLGRDGVYVGPPFVGRNAQGYRFTEYNPEYYCSSDYWDWDVVSWVEKMNSNINSFESWIHFASLSNTTEKINKVGGIFAEVSFNVRQ